MFQFDYISANDDIQRGLLAEGQYPFYVKQITEKPSKSSGKMMKEIILVIHDDHGKEHLVWDYIVAAKGMEWKSRHFLYSLGLGDMYEAKQAIPEHMLTNKKGFVSIGISNDPGFKPKNKVLDYINREAGVMPLQAEKEEKKIDEFNDDIPF